MARLTGVTVLAWHCRQTNTPQTRVITDELSGITTDAGCP